MKHVFIVPTKDISAEIQKELFKKGYSWVVAGKTVDFCPNVIFADDVIGNITSDTGSLTYTVSRLKEDRGYKLSLLEDVPIFKNKKSTDIDQAIKAFDCHEEVARGYHDALIEFLDKRYKKK